MHHQAFDGTGYPPVRTNGGSDVRLLAGAEIPMIGRIAAVADIYDAVSSSRPFRNPFHPVDAIRILRNEKGKKLDPELAEAFAKIIYPFPIGSTVILTTQELAVVIGYADEDKYQPVVKPIMKKVRRDGREEVERLPWAAQQSLTIKPESKIQIVVNKDIYELEDVYSH
jgi:HD-GYP domain-containing protein (c-di-GMP phosphodiesterase class II)